MAKSAYKRRRAGSLKEATERLIGKCGGFTDCGRDPDCRVGKATLYAYTDGDDDANRVKHMPIDVVRYLEARCGDPIVSRFLAAEAGHVMIRLDIPEDLAQLPPALATAAAEASDVYRIAAEALGDGEISRPEAEKLTREIDEAITAFAAMRQSLTRVRQDVPEES